MTKKKAYEFNANKVLSEKWVGSKNIFYVYIKRFNINNNNLFIYLFDFLCFFDFF